ncbi:MAG: redox-regulated ATPase YchF [Verrucomicrobia bacterium]|nr:redox-regulated ATPase YchF [Verrucomicrobiota bacterium]MCF7708944.1 redox-regulated ATPase YchF [Verrucomicrobiota bacterium]
MLTAGIIGLPNVGKSTLFNAVTKTRKAEAENYPFCTIDPNIGVVKVPEPRLQALLPIAGSKEVYPTTIEFFDIAGLVRGAHKGEGLGNKFLSHIRNVDALIHVLRCFHDDNIPHIVGAVDPIRDIETITTELILSDLEDLHKKKEKLVKEVKHGNKQAKIEYELMEKIEKHLDSGMPALTCDLHHDEKELSNTFGLLSNKPTVIAANVMDTDLLEAESNPLIQKLREYTRTHHSCDTIVISAQIESELADLSPDEAEEYLAELGVAESGLSRLIHSVYNLLELRTFFTFNEKELRAWTAPAGCTAPKAAGKIHTDFQHGFIKAETISWDDLVSAGSVHAAKEKGLYRQEGKDYIVRDGDVILFKFNL